MVQCAAENADIIQDNSDDQYASFRNNVPYLAILVIIHPLLRRGYERIFSKPLPTANGHVKSSTSVTSQVRLDHRLRYDLVSAIIFITALHGFSAFKVLFILFLNFHLTTALPRHMIPSVTWIFNIAILFANELARGYSYTSITDHIEPFYGAVGTWGKFLDSWGGLIPRWEVLFNITVLRLISFNFDYYWSLSRDRSGSPLEVSE